MFNIFFVKEAEKKHVVHCLRCARLQNPKLTGWICLGEIKIYSNELSTYQPRLLTFSII